MANIEDIAPNPATLPPGDFCIVPTALVDVTLYTPGVKVVASFATKKSATSTLPFSLLVRYRFCDGSLPLSSP